MTNDGTWTYAWQKGRQLASMAKAGTSASFVYNADGLRIQKTVNGAVTNYILHGKNIVHLSRGSDDMHFWYDAQNRPAIIDFNHVKYAYIHNLQGDVVGLRDTAGNEVVRYTYDAWGKMLSTTGSLASTLGYMNPFRYRGYVYDEETGLYYLKSRYYNPSWGRFVNADACVGHKVFGFNAFCYCSNNPVMRADTNGLDWEDIRRWATQAAANVGAWTAQAAADVDAWTTQAVADVKAWTAQAAADVGAWTVQAITDTGVFLSKSVRTVGTAINGINAEFGVGVGLGAEVSLGAFSMEAIVKDDIFHCEGAFGSYAEFGEVQQLSFGASVGVPGMKGVSLGMGMIGTYTHPYGAKKCTCKGGIRHSLACPAYDYKFTTDRLITFGGSLYIGVGGTLNISYNLDDVKTKIYNIWK